jgi:hypothetical protein
MKTTWKIFLVRCGHLLAHPTLWKILLHRLTRYAFAWWAALAAAVITLYCCWTLFDSDGNNPRRDGNAGHTLIDFGGQYLMGRMMVRGHGRHLYHRYYHREVLSEVYPRDDEPPEQERSDVENLMMWIMGNDDAQGSQTVASMLTPLAATDAPGLAAMLTAGRDEWTPDHLEHATALSIGGPLYPPINAFVYYPLALLPPRPAYRANQVLGIVLAFVAGLAVTVLSEGRVWCPVAAFFIILFPGFQGSVCLGQNAGLTLTILLWGWTFMARCRPVCGGMMWGLLAFKPVWAATFFLVPVLTRRWRAAAAMLLTGVTLASLTLPLVGWQSWLDWLQVGREATETYKTDQNWIQLSRDLLSLPRRWFDFDQIQYDARKENLEMAIRGWALLAAVLEITVLLAVFRRDEVRKPTGPPAAFVLLGAWLTCFHFMYYDVLLAALPVLVLLTEPRRFLEPLLVAIIPLGKQQLGENLVDYYQPRLTHSHPPPVLYLAAGYPNVWVLNRMIPTVVTFLFATASVLPFWGVGIRDLPWDTLGLLFLWAWCAWLVVHEAPRSKPHSALTPLPAGLTVVELDSAELVQLPADVGGAHQGFAHQHSSDAGRS